MVFRAYDGRSAIKATGEPSGRESRTQGAKIPDGRRLTGRRASIGLLDGAARGSPYTYRRKKKRKNYRRECTGSELVPMWVGMSAELGRHGCGGWCLRSCLARQRSAPRLWRTRAGPCPRRSRRLSSVARRAARDRHPQPLTCAGREVKTKPRSRRTRGDSAHKPENRHLGEGRQAG